MDKAKDGAEAAPEKPLELKSGKKKSPHQKRAEKAADRESWTQEQIDAAILANGGTPKTQTTASRGPGRPPLIEGIDLERVEMYAAGGLTKYEIAAAVGISETTRKEYEKEYPAFAAAIARGRQRLIGDVEEAMKKVALGHYAPEEKLQYDMQTGQWVREETIRYIPPDVKAQHLLLRKVETGSWKDKQDVSHSGQINQVVKYHRPERDKDDRPAG